MSEFTNAIRLNHRGFMCHSKKRFVLVKNKTGELDFTVYAIRNVENIPVFKGNLESVIYKNEQYFI